MEHKTYCKLLEQILELVTEKKFSFIQGNEQVVSSVDGHTLSLRIPTGLKNVKKLKPYSFFNFVWTDTTMCLYLIGAENVLMMCSRMCCSHPDYGELLKTINTYYCNSYSQLLTN